jgi:repressor LexA
MKRAEIEQKLQELLHYLDSFVSENGYPPSVREICKDLHLNSTATAFNYLEKLKSRGLINKSDSKNRAIGLCRTPNQSVDARVPTAPLLGEVACGTPIFAEENLDGYASYDGDVAADFCLYAKGDSMIDAGIRDGSIVFIKSQPIVDNGQIAVVLIEDEATLKRVYFDKDNKRMILNPANPAYAPIIVDSAQIECGNVRILGKAVMCQFKVV